MLTDVYKAEGAVLGDSFGTLYPDVFTDTGAEYHALTSTAGIIDLCHWGVLRLRGEDRVRLLNSLTTNDVAALEPGEACRSAMTTIKGKLVADLVLLLRESDVWVLVAQGDRLAVLDTIEKHVVADDVECDDVSGSYGVFSVEGPESRGVVWRLFSHPAIPAQRYQHAVNTGNDPPVTILNNNVSGEPGYQLIVPADAVLRIRNYLVQSGRANDAITIGRAAWNRRRVESGLPWWGSDVSPGENFPKECRLDDIVSYTKGCFMGQEPLSRMHHRGHPNRMLVGMVPASNSIPATPLVEGTELFTDAEPSKSMGRVTSSVFSPKLQSNLCMGFVKTAIAEPGTELKSRSGDVLVVKSLPVD
jgi:folate-binding protein YgfZ